jgi:hypothetical protein
MPSFEPRQFPPPSLSGVPIEYIVKQLHSLADTYWDKPETADCTISTFSRFSFLAPFCSPSLPVVPFPHAQGRPELPAFSQTSIIEPTIQYATAYEQTTLGKRSTQPPLNAVPRISMPVRFIFLISPKILLTFINSFM